MTTRGVATLALVLALAGVVIPYGLHDLRTYHANAYEWILAVAALCAILGLLVAPRLSSPRPWPFLLAALALAAQATYALFLPGAIWAARLSLALTFAGPAVLAVGAWVLADREPARLGEVAR